VNRGENRRDLSGVVYAAPAAADRSTRLWISLRAAAGQWSSKTAEVGKPVIRGRGGNLRAGPQHRQSGQKLAADHSYIQAIGVTANGPYLLEGRARKPRNDGERRNAYCVLQWANLQGLGLLRLRATTSDLSPSACPAQGAF
jgi:hypothetical protein